MEQKSNYFNELGPKKCTPPFRKKEKQNVNLTADLQASWRTVS